MNVLTAVDLLGIQRYVFSSNRLRDVAGASYLVNDAVSRDGAIAECDARANRIVGGGGNAILEFAGHAAAAEFAGRYSRWLIDCAPGLEAIIAHEPIKTGIADALAALFARVASAKSARTPSAPLLGLGVTAACRSTGLPAEGLDRRDGAPVSRAVRLIREASDEVRFHWDGQLLANVEKGGGDHEFPLDLDALGRSSGDTSLIAVVHIDGNGVGARIQRWLKAASDVSDDVVRQQYKEWSGAIDDLGHRAMRIIVDRVRDSIQGRNGEVMLCGTPDDLSFRLRRREEISLPLRPVILGGDDITFLCDGRIALDLAAAALDVFRTAAPIPHLGHIGACAGVAIVHSHAPILRAWDLAEQLCRSAKRKVRDSREAAFALDWHIGLPRPGQRLDSLRAEQYAATIGTHAIQLTSRPCELGDDKTIESWRWIERNLLDAAEDADSTSLRGRVWRERRNKTKQLGGLIRGGTSDVKASLDAWNVAHQEERFRLPAGLADGFVGARTPLLDAVELMDIHLALGSAASSSPEASNGSRP